MAMPQVPLFSTSDPILEAMQEVVTMIEGKMSDPTGLDLVEEWLEGFFGEMRKEDEYRGLTF